MNGGSWICLKRTSYAQVNPILLHNANRGVSFWEVCAANVKLAHLCWWLLVLG